MNTEVKPRNPETRLKEVEEENELLLLQLHQVQEELERYYLRNQELEKNQAVDAGSATIIGKGWVDDELPAMLAENRRLQALVAMQQQVHQQQIENALNVRLGNLLIEAADSPASLPAAVAKLLATWRRSTRQAPPKSLGGKDFGQVIAAHEQGGFAAAEQLMDGLSISAAMQANAWTVLARHLMKTDRTQAAEAATRAHALDPKPFRLKWLAFRLHEAGKLIDAEAMLDMLPADTPFSESEQAQASRLRHEARQVREREAKQQSDYAERRKAMEQQLKRLTKERDEQLGLAQEHNRTIETLKKEKAQLEQQKSALTQQHAAAAKLAEERLRETETLKQARKLAEQEKARLEKELAAAVSLAEEREKEFAAGIKEKDELKQENELLLLQLHQVQEELETYYLKNQAMEQQVNELTKECDEQSRLVQEHGVTIAALMLRRDTLEQDNATLAERLAEAEQLTEELIEEWGQEVDALRQRVGQSELERQALLEKLTVTEDLLGARDQETDSLMEALAQEQQDKQILSERLEEVTQRAEQAAAQVAELGQAKSRWAEEKAALEARDQKHEQRMEADAGKIATLTGELNRFQQERQALSERLEAAEGLLEAQAQEMQLQSEARLQLEQERLALQAQQDDAQRRLMVAGEETRELREACARLEQDRDESVQRLADATGLAEERGREVETLVERQARLEQESAGLTVRLQEIQQRLQTQCTHLATATTRLSEQHEQIEQLTQSKLRLEVESAGLAERHAEFDTTLADLRQQLAQSSQAVSLGLKLQTLREADLEELQVRYQLLHAREERHNLLLSRLGERLHAISTYFHEIADGEAAFENAEIEHARPKKKRTYAVKG